MQGVVFGPRLEKVAIRGVFAQEIAVAEFGKPEFCTGVAVRVGVQRGR